MPSRAKRKKDAPKQKKRTKLRPRWLDLVAEQGTKPIEDLDKFMEEYGDHSLDETADEIIAAIRAWRREGSKERKR